MMRNYNIYQKNSYDNREFSVTIRYKLNTAKSKYRIPASINAPIVTLNTEIPDTAAASGFPPTAYRFLPNVVLFQINHTMATAATAHRMMVGNFPICGMKVFGIAESIAPKDRCVI